MRQPGLLVMVAAPAGGGWGDAAGSLLQDGHLPIDASLAQTALARGGAGADLVRRLASQCDAALLADAPALDAVFRGLRRPIYRSPGMLPVAGREQPAAASWQPGWLPDWALRSLDR